MAKAVLVRTTFEQKEDFLKVCRSAKLIAFLDGSTFSLVGEANGVFLPVYEYGAADADEVSNIIEELDGDVMRAHMTLELIDCGC